MSWRGRSTWRDIISASCPICRCSAIRDPCGFASKGIRVNAVAPGPIWTPLQVSGGATQDKLEKFGGQTPLGRPGQPAELASIYVQLAMADASYATGQVYGSAGGSEFNMNELDHGPLGPLPRLPGPIRLVWACNPPCG